MKKRYKRILIFISLIFSFVVFLWCENNLVGTSKYTLEFDTLPKNFNNFKILQISDLHSKSFGENQKRLLKKIEKVKPDIILFTGDMIDSKRYDEKPALDLIAGLENKYPLFFVTGNHEAWSGKWNGFKEKLQKHKINILNNEGIKYIKDNEYIYICGLVDPAFNHQIYNEENNKLNNIEDLIKEEKFTILLSHRPEKFSKYVDDKFDLIFSGHAHGGQVRLPFIGGLVAPDQGFNPKYYGGVYTKEKNKMIVNRGLGNSIIPQRIFNRPELVVVTLKVGSDEQ